MTGEEGKRALLEQFPVIYNGMEYLYVDEIRYRRNRYGGIIVLAVLFDKCRHSFVNAPLKDVEIAK